MKNPFLVFFVPLLATLLTPLSAAAIPVSFAFEGVIESVTHVTSTDTFGTGIAIGTLLNGRYTFDTATTNSGNSGYGVYIESNPNSGLNVQIGAFSGSSSSALVPLNYRIVTEGLNNNDVVQDIQTQDMVFGGVNAYLAQIFLEGPSGSLFNVDLSATPPNLADYFLHKFVLGIGPPTHAADVIYFGEITSIRAVSEPPILGLFALTAFALWGASCAGQSSRRRRTAL